MNSIILTSRIIVVAATLLLILQVCLTDLRSIHSENLRHHNHTELLELFNHALDRAMHDAAYLFACFSVSLSLLILFSFVLMCFTFAVDLIYIFASDAF